MLEKFQLGGHSVFWPMFGNTFVNFWRKKSFFVGLLIPLFGLLVTSSQGFKARMDSLVCALHYLHTTDFSD